MTWKIAVLEVLKGHSGKPVDLQDIYVELWRHPLVTDRHGESWSPGLQHRCGGWIRRCLTTLVEEGTVERIKKSTYRYIG
jgi:hypothetical protein